MLRLGGLCFLAVRPTGFLLNISYIDLCTQQLPLPCVNNSRYMTIEHMNEIMNAIGFQRLEERWKPGGKMMYWLYQKKTPQKGCFGERFSKKVLRQGNRNNFHILVT
jgi:25S rRNA (adenine2142-N1)-methyltransferase